MQIEISAAKISFPGACACCGGPGETELSVSATRSRGKRVVHTTSKTWAFPYCRRCVEHVEKWDSGANAFTLALTVGGILAVLSLWSSAVLAALVVVVAVAGGLALQSAEHRKAAAMCSPSCVQASRAVDYLGWSGSLHTFEVSSPRYASEFLQANLKKVVNLRPEARELLQADAGQKPARASSRRNGSSRAEAPEISSRRGELDLLASAVARLESLKGPAARRTALEAALRSIASPEIQERLLLEASKIEVQAALDRVDGLKTPAAKRRTLQSALDDVRQDPIPDELQAQQIAWLEDALAELEVSPGQGEGATSRA